MAKPKDKSAGLLKPGMLTLAAVALWSAQHEPGTFDTASVGTWLLGAVAAALTVRAGLALFAPLLALCTAILGQAYQTLQDRIES